MWMAPHGMFVACFTEPIDTSSSPSHCTCLLAVLQLHPNDEHLEGEADGIRQYHRPGM